jgi:hypothetical protein
MMLIEDKKNLELQLNEYKTRLNNDLAVKPNTDFKLDSKILNLKKQIDLEIDNTKTSDLISSEKIIELELEKRKLKSITSNSSQEK